MNQILKILLDHPDKTERFILWFFQAAIVVWVMSTLFGFDIIQIQTENGDLVLDFPHSINAVTLASYLIVFIVLWFLIWGFLAEHVIKLIYKCLRWILKKITVIGSLILIIPISYIVLLILSYFKKNERPKIYLKRVFQDKQSNDINEYDKKVEKLSQDFELFQVLNNRTGSSIGSQMLLAIISLEKGEFIRSRIIRYYSIAATIGIIQIYEIGIENNISALIWGGGFLFLIGLLVFGLSDFYSRLNENVVLTYIPRLEQDILMNYMHKNILSSPLSRYYAINRKRKFISLEYKEDLFDIQLMPNYVGKILFVHMNDNPEQQLETLRRHHNSEGMMIFVAQSIPNIEIIKRIEMNKQCLIVAANEDEFFEGIEKLMPIISGAVSL